MDALRDQRILIAGCGYVGGRLAELLVESGSAVFALSRRPGARTEDVTGVRADLANPETLEALPAHLDAVVFAASPSSPDEAGYRAIFIDGLRNVIEALVSRERPPKRIVFTSSTAVYGQANGEWVDETAETDPARFNGKVLLEAESLVHEAAIPGCVLRLGGIYGPGRARQIERVRDGLARLDPGAPSYTNRIHREDAARSLLHLLALPAPDPVYLGVDDEPADGDEVQRFIAAELGMPEPAVAERGAPRRAGSKRCRNRRLVKSGYRFVYPTFREGFRALIASRD